MRKYRKRKDPVGKSDRALSAYIKTVESSLSSLIDIRHDPSANDKMMYQWIVDQGFQPIIIATKLDKLKTQSGAEA